MSTSGIQNEMLVLNVTNPNELDVDGLKGLIANSAISISAGQQRLQFCRFVYFCH
jgi:hypothetical protein